MYNVIEFVKAYKNAGMDTVKQQKLLKEINIKNYIPYNLKRTMAEKLLRDICMEDVDFYYNSPKRYLAYIMSVIVLYTELECSQEDSSLDYDLLRESGVLEQIILLIGEDIKEYKTLWTMCYEDLVQNENSLINIIRKNVERMGTLCDYGLLKLSTAINNLTSHNVEEVVSNIKEKAQDFMQK